MQPCGTKRESSSSVEGDTPNKKLVTTNNVEAESTWDPNKNTILVVTKAKDNKLITFTQHLVEWLIFTPRFGKKNPFIVYVDAHLKDSKLFGLDSLKQKDNMWETNLLFWTPKLCYKSPELFHLIITLGGDGTILFTSTLFQSHVPPIIPFHLGSLGFLAPFLFTNYQQELRNLFEGRLHNVTNRMRLKCTVYRYKHDPRYITRAKKDPKDNSVWTSVLPVEDPTKESSLLDDPSSWELMETAWMRKTFTDTQKRYSKDKTSLTDKKIMCYATRSMQTFHVLNEIIVDRGPNSTMSMLELFGNERHLTTVQADGLCIATATGSTAYSLSAGGTLTHPDMQCTLVTPICPHTLSFRPMLLPSAISIRIFVPFGSRHSAYCRFDGRDMIELKQGDHITITLSPHPVKTYSSCDTSNDWFSSVQSCLLWNNRKRQRSFVVVESDTNQPTATESNNRFACLGPNEVDDVGLNDDLNQDTDSLDNFELSPWTEEELTREPIKTFAFTNDKKESKI